MVAKKVVFLQLRNLSNSLRISRSLISFPERPSIADRYSSLEAVKNMQIPKHHQQQQTHIMSFQKPVLKEVFVESRFIKENGVSVFVTDKLPEKYKRPTLSEEEIEYIMRGGREL